MIDEMPRPRPQYLYREETRHGRSVWYVRKGQGKRIRIRAEYGTEAFQQEYDAAVAGVPVEKPKTKSGSLRWLVERYMESSAWGALSPATRKQRDNIFKHVLAASGDRPFTAIRPKDIEAGKERRKDTPAQARNFLDAMRGLFVWALEVGHNTTDPTAGVKNPKKKKTEGFKPWVDEEVALYKKKWPLGTKEYVWLCVLLYIGPRRGDAVVLGRQHTRGTVISFITEKGRDHRRIEVTRRLEPELIEAIEAGPCGDLSYICGERGTPLTKESFGNVFKDACVAAGIPDKSAHGLRKLAATTWAERGATVHELMAMFGWLTVAMAELYTRAAERKRLALNAHDRLSTSPIGHNGGPKLSDGTVAEHPIPAPDQEVRDLERKAQ